MLITFEKIAEKQLANHKYVEKYAQLFSYFLDPAPYIFSASPLNHLCYDLLFKFKQNPYKTHSCFDDVMAGELNNRFWVSYTVEDENKKRIWTREYCGKFLAFKIYMKIGNYRKNRIARWRVPLTWHNSIN
jgi:hypothetical protein